MSECPHRVMSGHSSPPPPMTALWRQPDIGSSSSVPYLIVRSHDGLELPAWMRCAMRRAWPGPGFIGNPHDGRPSDEPSEVAMKDNPSMSMPCPPSNGDNASNCNAPATEVTGRNVVRFPVERCRRPDPAGDQWVARADAGLGAQTLGGRDTYAARSGAHDDLVLAVALAVWFAERAGLGRGLIKSVGVGFRA